MARNACVSKLGILSIKNRSFPYNNLGLLNVFKLNKENNSKDLNNAQNSVFKGYILFFSNFGGHRYTYRTRPLGQGLATPTLNHHLITALIASGLCANQGCRLRQTCFAVTYRFRVRLAYILSLGIVAQF